MVAGPTEILGGLGALAARARPAGLFLGAPLALAGLAALTVGTRHRRLLALAGLAALGALAAVLLRGPLAHHLGLSAGPAGAVLAAAGAVVGVLFPAAFPFAAAALPGALVGAELPVGGRASLGAALGALVAGVVGLLLARVVTAVAAALVGAVALALGLVACLGETPLVRELAERPAAVAGFAVILGIAGAALQLSRPPATSPAAPIARSPGSPS
jgi:hypothetical protein